MARGHGRSLIAAALAVLGLAGCAERPATIADPAPPCDVVCLLIRFLSSEPPATVAEVEPSPAPHVTAAAATARPAARRLAAIRMTRPVQSQFVARSADLLRPSTIPSEPAAPPAPASQSWLTRPIPGSPPIAEPWFRLSDAL